MSAPPGLSAAAVRPLPPLTDDPATVDLATLDWLDDVVAGARVVAIGESSHFATEFHRLRRLLVRHLVERHGFTAYAMESGFVEGHRVDAWLSGGVPDAETDAVLAHGLTSLMGLFVEQRRLLEWLRSAPARVRFYGVDTPGSNVSLLPALDLVEDYLARADPDLQVDPDLRRLASVGAASSVFAASAVALDYANLPTRDKDAITAGLSLLLARLRARRPAHHGSGHGHGLVPTDFDRAEHGLRSAVALDAFRRNATHNVRDLFQADTVEWILRREEKVVFAAHNGHVQRWPVEFPGVLPPSATAGQHLDLRLGSQYRVIGTTTGPGRALTDGPAFFQGRFFDELPAPPPGTLDAVLAGTPADGPFGVDLHRLDPSDRATLGAARTQRSGAYLCPVDPLAAYDALVHLPSVSPAEPDPGALAAAPPEVAEVFGRYLEDERPGR